MTKTDTDSKPNASLEFGGAKSAGCNNPSGKTNGAKRMAASARPASAPKAPTKTLTKKAQLISLLGSKRGVTVEQIRSKLGWLPHTTRAVLTGLRKAGFEIELTKPKQGGAGSYRIMGSPESSK